MRNWMLRLSLLLLCLPLLGGNCDGNSTSQRAANSQSQSDQSSAQQGLVEQPGDSPANPIPEPSAALIFGAGVLIVCGALKLRKKRD